MYSLEYFGGCPHLKEPPCNINRGPGPCYGYVCDNPSAECVVNGDGDPECVCPSCVNAGHLPVCGVIGVKMSTFHSECSLHRAACKANVPYEVVQQSKCTEEPATCTRVPVFRMFIDENDCVSETKVELHDCQGSCGDIPDDCCLPRTSNIISFMVRCPNGQYKKHYEPVPASCYCHL
ncbi:hypothetical protein ScPMuIL_012823 [Solemya velum]